MRGFGSAWMAFTAPVVLLLTLIPSTAEAQARRPARSRRETNANRRARIDRAIADTYSHRWEIAGGGGYLRFRSGESLQKNNEVTFFGSTSYFLNPKLGILADAHGAYGNAKIGNNDFNLPNPQISEYMFTAGPEYRFYAKQKTAATAFVTGGVGYGKFAGSSKNIPPQLLGLWSTPWRAAFTAGVNFDYNFYPNLAFRIAPTYIGTTFDGSPYQGVQTVHGTVQNNLGFNIGVVYRLGRQK